MTRKKHNLLSLKRLSLSMEVEDFSLSQWSSELTGGMVWGKLESGVGSKE